jgi:O-acetyl-ADP-ribose deacetylase (regulator of RNase III)
VLGLSLSAALNAPDRGDALRRVPDVVGPVWRGGNDGEPGLLASCYETSLRLGAEKGCKTFAFPAISTGIYGYPADQAAEIAVNTIRKTLTDLPQVEKVVLVAFDASSKTHLETALRRAQS